MLRVYFSAALLCLAVAIWALQAQTLGHVYLYVALCAVSALGLKILLPYAWVLGSLLCIWWGLTVSCTYADLGLVLTAVSYLLLGRNAF